MGLVVCSPSAERALLAELAWLAHHVAAPCTDVALADRPPDTADARRALRAACGWLRAFSGSVQAANRAAPVSATDRDLLLAIPLNAPLPRPLLDGSEQVRSEEHTSELQSRGDLVCRLLLEKKKRP